MKAALIDGATKIRTFLHITLPLLKPFIVINLILITMWSVNFFDLQLVLTGGGPLFASTTASLYMYRQAFEFGLLSKGASYRTNSNLNQPGYCFYLHQTLKKINMQKMTI